MVREADNILSVPFKHIGLLKVSKDMPLTRFHVEKIALSDMGFQKIS